MFLFGSPDSEQKNENNWRRKLDKFVKANKQELAALAWGLFREKIGRASCRERVLMPV